MRDSYRVPFWFEKFSAPVAERPPALKANSMYRVTVSARFEAAHNLIDYEGGPEPLHGHSYRVDAVLETHALHRHDVALDFAAARSALEKIANELDYTYLNEHPAFAGRNTSAENLAAFFSERLEASGTLGPARVAEVTVWEGPENRATYLPTASRS